MVRIFGWTLLSSNEKLLEDGLWSEIVSNKKQTIETLTHRIQQLENEIEYYRKRADDERERADRQLDALMQQNGLPEVTATTRRDDAERSVLEKDRQDKREQVLAEIFAESLGVQHDEFGLELPEELQIAAAELMPEKE